MWRSYLAVILELVTLMSQLPNDLLDDAPAGVLVKAISCKIHFTFGIAGEEVVGSHSDVLGGDWWWEDGTCQDVKRDLVGSTHIV